MRLRYRRTAAVLAAALSGVVFAAEAAEWDEILAKPLSPGSVALLVEHASDPRVVARWSEALKDPRPAVRAAAARAINVTGTASLAPDLTAARASETDPAAVREEAAALAAFRDTRGWRPPPSTERPAAWRTADGFPPELVPDVLRVSGCSARNKEEFHGGQVWYGPDGRPRQVGMLAPTRVSAACAEAAKALLFLSLAPAEAVGVAGRIDLVILPLAPEVIACMGEPRAPAAAPSGPSRVGGHIEAPRKVRHVNPWYPDAAKYDRVQGTVVLEAVIAPTGCVSSVKLLQSRDPRLDLVALITVARWRYTPTLINGVAVPVIMTVTVNFRLS